eukprot:gb/GECH01012756.1/.p1 GENE.gb/GECH01012756.1/~~gb/GECH01012756.1/.p1  ORF type:complete len:134 (+),score=38.37 gb/GECH01012756.1/:1-402(+)
MMEERSDTFDEYNHPHQSTQFYSSHIPRRTALRNRRMITPQTALILLISLGLFLQGISVIVITLLLGPWGAVIGLGLFALTCAVVGIILIAKYISQPPPPPDAEAVGFGKLEADHPRYEKDGSLLVAQESGAI